MIDTTSARVDAASPPHPPPLLRRLVAVLLSPRETFTRLAAHPRVLGALLVTTLAVAGANAAYLATETGRTALLDELVARAERAGVSLSDEQYARMQSMVPLLSAVQPVGILVFIPLVSAALAGVLYGAYGAMLGGDRTYKHVLAIVAHANVVFIVLQLFTLPINFVQGSIGSRANLGVFVPALDEGSFLAVLLGTIDLFVVWWVVLLSIGLGVLFRRTTTSIFVTLAVIYTIVALAIAVFTSVQGS